MRVRPHGRLLKPPQALDRGPRRSRGQRGAVDAELDVAPGMGRRVEQRVLRQQRDGMNGRFLERMAPVGVPQRTPERAVGSGSQIAVHGGDRERGAPLTHRDRDPVAGAESLEVGEPVRQPEAALAAPVENVDVLACAGSRDEVHRGEVRLGRGRDPACRVERAHGSGQMWGAFRGRAHGVDALVEQLRAPGRVRGLRDRVQGNPGGELRAGAPRARVVHELVQCRGGRRGEEQRGGRRGQADQQRRDGHGQDDTGMFAQPQWRA